MHECGPATSLNRLLGTAVLLCAALALAAPADSRAHTRVVGPSELQPSVNAFLVSGPPGPVRILLAPCPADPAAQGCHSSDAAMDTVWLNPDAGGLDAETLGHEMGHVFESYMWDLYWRKREDGARFVPRLFKRVASILFTDPGPGILYSTAWSERFAEAYSLCARVAQLSAPVSTGYWGFQTTPEGHARTCRLIDAMGRDYRRATAGSPSVAARVVARG